MDMSLYFMYVILCFAIIAFYLIICKICDTMCYITSVKYKHICDNVDVESIQIHNKEDLNNAINKISKIYDEEDN